MSVRLCVYNYGIVGLFLGGFGVVFVLDEFGWVFVVGGLDFVVLC